MLIHAVVDYSFLYYKYKFQLDSGKIRRLTAAIDWKGTVIEKDISQIYYSIKEIEGFRRKIELAGHDAFVSICFDMPTDRKEHMDGVDDSVTSKYKSNRVKRLSDEDFENIQFVERVLSDAGYNTYRFKNYEADDLVAHLVHNYSEVFDYTIIYTPDADLLVHVSDKVGASRYKATKGYANIDKSNFCSYLSDELKCTMSYNGLILYKCTVGDKSDCIDGIKKFGPKAFDKLVDHLNKLGMDWSTLAKYDSVSELLHKLYESGYFTEEQIKQAHGSLMLIKPKQLIDVNVPDPNKHSTRELREASYMRYGMKSLVD